jgi:folate-binding protein YgfZ
MVAADTALTDEHALLRDGCGLLDRSDRGRLALTGSDAATFLNGQVTNDVEGLQVGTGCYAALLTHKGKMLADLRVIAPDSECRLGLDAAPALVLDTERAGLQALFDTIRRYRIGHDVELYKLTMESVQLSLIGPRADDVLRGALARPVELPDREHANRAGEIGGAAVLLVRTDVGCDVLAAAADASAVVAALTAAGAAPVSAEAAEVLRVERGRPRYGIELDDSVIPQEAGLNERAVSFTKGCYVGQETVARLYYKGKPNRFLRGLLLSTPVPAGAELRSGDRPVGRVGSSVISPQLGPIGLALVRREVSPGDVVDVGGAGATARVTELPLAG